jgi:hypothetical protein
VTTATRPGRDARPRHRYLNVILTLISRDAIRVEKIYEITADSRLLDLRTAL